jgi:hypothetical protein
MHKKPIYGGRMILITDTAEITTGAFLKKGTSTLRYSAESHRIWIFFCTPALFLKNLCNFKVNSTRR